ncbi:MAG: hypothetical protein WD534_01405 [Phycisphaeraceae bacterium]
MLDTPAKTCPLTRDQAINRYFLEHRAKLIDIAAFLDRLDRAPADAPADDYRINALHRALDLLRDGRPDRARRVLELFSDPTTDPIPKAHTQAASGAHPEA